MNIIVLQVGVVGLLAHMLHLHMTTSSPSLQCLALSLVPPSHAHSEDSLTLTRLGHLVSWLRDTVPVNKHDSQEVSNSFTHGKQLESIICQRNFAVILTIFEAYDSVLIDS